MPTANDRYARQNGLVPTSRAQEVLVTVIGVGAVGRQIALQLASIGVQHMTLIDHDLVEDTNIVTQGYFVTDVGKHKVNALSDTLERINPDIDLTTYGLRYARGIPTGEVVFCAVDSIDARSEIWAALTSVDRPSGMRFWADTRMLGETIRIMTADADKPGSYEAYARTLFVQADAQVGRCTARSTIYAASLAASLAVHQFTRWLRHYPLDNDLLFNLLASELTVGGIEEPA